MSRLCALLAVSAAANCNNRADKKILYADGTGKSTKGSTGFFDDLSTCGRKAWGVAKKTKVCMGGNDKKNSNKLSKGCTNCYVETVACGADNCKSKCWWSKTAACVQCSKTNCNSALAKCAGIQKSELPKDTR